MKVTVHKSQRVAWDATMREEVGMNIPGQPLNKRRLTRSAKDRTSSLKKQNVHGGVSDLEFKRRARLERLELTNAWDPIERSLDQAYDDGGDSSGEESKKRRRTEKRNANSRKQIFLADVILSEGLNDFVKAAARKSTRPALNRVCDVTGKVGRYQDPLTGLFFYDRKALAIMREQVPSWMKQTAISPYWDAIKNVSDSES